MEGRRGHGLAEDEPLLRESVSSAVNSAEHGVAVRVYPVRWWVLFQLSFLSFNQSLFWITFSPVAESTKRYYGISDTTVTWWMNVGVASAILAFLFTSKYLASRGDGLKAVCTGSVIAQAVAMVARLVPVWIGAQRSTGGIVTVYAAQFVVGVVGPMVMAAPPLLSNLWFPPEERAMATAIGYLSNNFGSGGGFLLGPLLVQKADDMPTLLYTHAAIALANAVLLLSYFPAAPPLPPSHSSGTERAEAVDEAHVAGHSFGGIWDVVTSGPFLLIGVGFGTLNGVFNVWSGSFDQILPPLGHHYDQVTCGWLGFGATMAMILGGILTGAVIDIPPWNRRFAVLLRLGAAATCAIMALFTVAMPILGKAPPITLPFAAVSALIVLSGFTLGCCTPIAFEAAAEITFPVPESTSANIIVLVINVSAFVYLFVTPPLLDREVLNIVIAGCALFAFLLCAMAPIRYTRLDFEKAHTLTSPEVLAAPGSAERKARQV